MNKKYLEILCKDLKQEYNNYKKQIEIDNTDIHYYGSYYTLIIEQEGKSSLFYIESAVDLLEMENKFDNIIYICKHPSLVNGVLVPNTDYDSEIGNFKCTSIYMNNIYKKFGVK